MILGPADVYGNRCIAKELALLMASNPTTRMVSHVDEVDDAIIKEGIFRALEAKSKVTSPIASYSTAPSDNATLKHHPAPPSDSEAPGDSVKKNQTYSPLSLPKTLPVTTQSQLCSFLLSLPARLLVIQQ